MVEQAEHPEEAEHSEQPAQAQQPARAAYAANETALLVIDAQLGLLGEEYPSEKAVLESISALLERARSAGAAVIYMQHDGGPGHPLNPATADWPINPLVGPREGELVIPKHASDSFYKTPLGRELDARGIRRLVVTGAQTEYCVDTTCRRASSEGYEVTLAADAHSTGDSNGLTAQQIIAWHNATLADLAQPDHPITVLPASAISFTAAPTTDTEASSAPSPVASFPAPTTKAGLLAMMAQGRAQWDALLAEAQSRGVERMEEAGAAGAWSVKDTVIHVAYYQRRLGAMLRAALAGEPYTRTTLDQLGLDERNERIYAEGQARPLAEALEEEQIGYERLRKAVERVPEADLFDVAQADKWVAWEEDAIEPLWQSVASETYEHYAEHLPALRAWLAQ